MLQNYANYQFCPKITIPMHITKGNYDKVIFKNSINDMLEVLGTPEDKVVFNEVDGTHYLAFDGWQISHIIKN